MIRAQLLLFAALACGLPIQAQWNGAATYNLGMGMGPIALMTGNLSLGRMATEEAFRSDDTKSTKPPTQNSTELVFQSNPAVSADLRQKFEQTMLSLALPGKRDSVQQQLAKFEPVSIFNAALQKSGFSPNDVADAATAYIADSWQLMNNAPDPPQATLSAVDRQMRGALMQSHALAKLTSDQKQQIAEFLAYEDVLNVLETKAPGFQTDPSRQAQARQNLAIQFQRLVGLDLHRLNLTPSGLSLRP